MGISSIDKGNCSLFSVLMGLLSAAPIVTDALRRSGVLVDIAVGPVAIPTCFELIGLSKVQEGADDLKVIQTVESTDLLILDGDDVVNMMVKAN
jgi:hypothetical protein